MPETILNKVIAPAATLNKNSASETILNKLETEDLILKPFSHNFPTQGVLVAPPASITAPMSSAESAVAATIPTKAIELRLRNVTILDLFEGLPGAIFGGSNEIKIISLVFDGNSKDPFKFEVGSFPGIKENQSLPFGDAGLAVYFSEPEKLPRFLDWRLLIIEDDSDVRNAGKIIQQIQATPEYKAIVDVVLTLVNPTWGAITQITSGVISLIAKAMEQNQDDVISLFAATYTLPFDRLGVGSHTFFQEKRSRVSYEILVSE